MDDAFGWSTQYAAEPCLPSRPSDDDDGLLSAFLCTRTSFHDGALHSSSHGGLAMSSSRSIPNLVHRHDGTGLLDSVPAPPAFMGLDTAADMLPSVTAGAVGGGLLLDAFAYVPNVVAEGATAQATVSNSNTVFSGYSSTTGGGNGGNISSGESNSNTCGGGRGQDIEVASPCAAVSRPTLLHRTPTTLHHHPSDKRKLDNKYPATCVSATTTTAGAKRAAAASSSSSTSITFGDQSHHQHQDAEAMAQVKEMIYRAAAMRPVHQLVRAAAAGADLSQDKRRRRRNVRISSDPQTVAARLRRERVSERLRVLQRLVPGGSRMDTASMLDEAASYLKFLKAQLQALENPSNGGGGGDYCNGSSSLLQNYYTGNNNLASGGTSSGGGSTVLAFGSRDGIVGYVKSNRTMPL